MSKKYYFLNCYKCNKHTKVSISDFNKKNRVYCKNCLANFFKKIKSN